MSKMQNVHSFEVVSDEIYQKPPDFCFTSKSGNTLKNTFYNYLLSGTQISFSNTDNKLSPSTLVPPGSNGHF